MCGGAYALKRVEQVSSPPEYTGNSKGSDNLFPDAGLADNTGQASGSTGVSDSQTKVAGLREGVWFRRWEGTIRRAVLNRLQESDPLISEDGVSPPIMLDGYHDNHPLNVV